MAATLGEVRRSATEAQRGVRQLTEAQSRLEDAQVNLTRRVDTLLDRGREAQGQAA